jgi:formamidopyrimidine-DNA glycosylase
MPELPEVETIARGLQLAVTGAEITGVTIIKRDILRGVSPAALRRRVSGAEIVRVWRRAKHVVMDLSTGDRLVVQPRFTGALLIDAGDLPEIERRYSTLQFGLGDGRILHYRDIRRLGTVSLMNAPRFSAYTAAIGVEPLDPVFTSEHLSGLLRVSRQAIKKVIMDQRRLAGVGNIYANEALWRAGIKPSRAARRIRAPAVAALHAGIVSVLREAVAARGTSLRDYRDAAGNPGDYALQLAAYSRAGLPCMRCGTLMVSTHTIDRRRTVYCPSCQR